MLTPFQGFFVRLIQSYKPYVVLGHDLTMALLTIPLSLLLRTGDEVLTYPTSMVLFHSSVYVLISLSVFLTLRIYSGVWRYVSAYDVLRLVMAVAAITILYLPMMLIMGGDPSMPKSMILITPLVLSVLLGSSRFMYRLWGDHQQQNLQKHILPKGKSNKLIPILLYGVNDHSESFIRHYKRESSSHYNILGLLDDGYERMGRHIHGIEILGPLKDLPDILEQLPQKPETIIQYPLPATAVNVEAVTIDCQAVPPTVAKDKTPEPFVVKTCPLVPSAEGNVNVKSADKEAGADKET